MNILVTMPVGEIRDAFFPAEAVKKLELMGTVVWNEKKEQLCAEELKKIIRDVDVCITGWGSIRFDKDILESAQELKVIAHTGGSVAAIVSELLYEKGIFVISGNSLYAEAVAEGAIAYMLCALRQIPYYQSEVLNGHWPPPYSFREGLLDQSMGLVGFGAIARALVKMLQPFRVKIKAYDPYVNDDVLKEYGVERASLEDIFSKYKIISIHAAKTSGTNKMIGKELLQTIPDGALFVNTARASVIDGDVLIEELQKNRFKAILDVFDVEPLPADSKLRGLPNAILLPHMAGSTTNVWKHATSCLIDDIERIFDGKQPTLKIEKAYAMAMTV